MALEAPRHRRLALIKQIYWDFPGSPVVKISPSQGGDVSPGAKIPHASWPKSQNIKLKQYCNKFNKDFKKDSHQNKTKQNNNLKNKLYEVSNLT